MSGEGEALARAVAGLGRGALVVAAHERAAAAFRRRYDRQQRHAGHTVWEPPAVRSWPAWRRELWRELLLEGRAEHLLLSAEQELSLWRAIIEEDTAQAELASIDRLADAARVAWSRLCAFRGQSYLRAGQSSAWTLADDAPTADTAAFARWAGEFVRRCRERRLLSESELDRALCRALDAGSLRLPWRELLLFGFADERAPAETALLEALRKAGVAVSEIGSSTQATARVARAENDDAELRACARWCRGQLAQGHSAAIVLADQTQAQALGRVLRETLPPDVDDAPARAADGSLFAFSQAGPAAQQPMIAVALDVLRLATGALPLERVSSLLRSRYFAYSADRAQREAAEREPLLWATDELVDTPEWAARAEFDAFELREHARLRPELTLAALLREVRGSKRVSRLRRLLEALEGLRREGVALSDGRRGYGFWAERMRALLRGAGWHTRRDGGVAAEAQLERLWESLLDTLATLDFADPRVTMREALDRLERIAAERLFRPSFNGESIAIVSPRELVEGEFDAVWCLGVGETTWPATGASVPLLPWRVQQELGMPGTDQMRDRQRLIGAWTKIAASAPEVIFSYAQQAAEARQRATPALRALDLDEVAADELAEGSSPREVATLETVRDGARLPALPGRVLRGGARVLEAQAACGFRAFAEHRLWSTAIADGELGLDSAQRGTLVHRALEQIWKRIEGREQLRAMSSTERRRVLDDAVEHSLSRAPWPGEAAWENAYVGLERERLCRLLDHWLDVEAARPDFTVQMQERALDDVAVGPLRLSVRIDRVDLVAGRRVLIDYKTGKAATQSWRGERPNAPQLPLYAVLTQKHIQEHAAAHPDDGARDLGAIAFATVHAGSDAKLRGFADTGHLLPHRDAKMDAADFEQQMDRWRDVLETLAEEFASGIAAVRPKKYPGTCAHCAQRMLCRLDPVSLEENAEEDEAWEADRG